MTLLSSLSEWIGERTGTVIMIPHPTMIGNCAEQIYHGFLKARREKKKLALLFQYPLPWPSNFRLTNHELLNIESDYRAFPSSSPWYFIGNVFVTAYVAVSRALNLITRRLGRPISDRDIYPCIGHTALWQPKETMPGFSNDIVAGYDWPAQMRSRLPVYLEAQKRETALLARTRMGLPEEAWFVCVHVRESGFHNDTMAERNASILNYVEAINEVTSRGGWVVRLGDPTMTRLPPMERVIDYPFTLSRSPLMDLYLISECRAYIGMQSGILDIASLFQRPIILTNMASWLYPLTAKIGDMGVLKHVYSKSKRRFLSVREWMSEPFAAVSFFALGEDYELCENDPEELRQVVREYLDRDGNTEPTLLQRECYELQQLRGMTMIQEPIIKDNPYNDLHNRYRIACRLVSSGVMISDAYLRQNWECDARVHA